MISCIHQRAWTDTFVKSHVRTSTTTTTTTTTRFQRLKWLAMLNAVRAASGVPDVAGSDGCVPRSGTSGRPSQWSWLQPFITAVVVVRESYGGPRAQKTPSSVGMEVEEHEMYEAPWRPEPLPLGVRPGLPLELGRLSGESPLFVVPSLRGGDSVDGTTVSLLLLMAPRKEEHEKEKEERRKEEEKGQRRRELSSLLAVPRERSRVQALSSVVAVEALSFSAAEEEKEEEEEEAAQVSCLLFARLLLIFFHNRFTCSSSCCTVWPLVSRILSQTAR